MLELPALDPSTVEERRGSGYPEPFKSRIGDRVKRRLAAACGLKNLGVNLVTLGPGGQSSARHWHTLEDEFVYVLEGEVVLVTNEGQQTLSPGMCAGYPAGSKNGHHFINRSQKPAKYLEMGTNVPGDTAFYPDDDLGLMETEDREMVYVHRDGRRY
jgi:uncharacterized cupin superfamily protein